MGRMGGIVELSQAQTRREIDYANQLLLRCAGLANAP